MANLSLNFFSVEKPSPLLEKELQKITGTINYLAMPAIVTDSLCQVIYINDAAKNVFSDKNDLIGSAFYTQGLLKEDFESFKSDPSNNYFRFNIRLPGGEMRTVQATLSHVEETGLIIILLDLFKLQPSEKESDLDFFEELLGNAPLAIYTRDLSGRVLFWNKKTEEIFQDPPFAFSAALSDDKRAAYIERERKIVEENKVVETEQPRHIDRHGNVKSLKLIKVPLIREGKEPVILSIVEDVTDTKHQEREFAAQKNMLQAILDKAPISIYAITPEDKKIIYFNEKSKELELNLVEDNDTDENFYRGREADILKSGKVLDIPEESYETATGKKLLLHILKTPIYDENGEPLMVLTLAEDITDRKAQEQELVESRNLLQTILHNAPLGIYAIDLNGKVIYENELAVKINKEELRDEKADAFFRNRDLRVAQDNKILDIPEELYRMRDGSVRTMHIIKTPILNNEGKPTMILTIAEDITERKQHEKEVLDSKNFLQKVVDNIPVALSARKAGDGYILWNKKSEELFGVKSSEVIGKRYYRENMSPEQKDYFEAQDNAVFESGKEYVIPQEIISLPSGAVKIMQTMKTPVFNPDGSADYLLSVSEDITEKVKMEKQIKEAGEKYSMLVENTNEGILIVDDKKIIFANSKVAQMTAMPDVSLLHKANIFDLVADKDKDMLQTAYNNILNGKDSSALLTLNLINSATKQFTSTVESHMTVARYLGRRITLLFFRPLAEPAASAAAPAAQAEPALSKGGVDLDSVFESAAMPLLKITSNYRIAEMNAKARDLFGVTKEDRLIYKNYYIKPGLPLEVRRRLEKGESAETAYTFDAEQMPPAFALRLGLKGRKKMHAYITPLVSDSGDMEFLAALTEEADVKLPPAPPMAPEAKKEEVFDDKNILSLNKVIIKCGAGFAVEGLSSASTRLLGKEEEELKKVPFFSLFDPACKTALERDLTELRSAGVINQRTHKMAIDGGKFLETEISGAKIKGGGYIFFLRNAAPDKQLKDLIKEAEAREEAFISSLQGGMLVTAIENGVPGAITECSCGMEDLTGRGQKELTSMKAEELLAKNGITEGMPYEVFMKEKMQELSGGHKVVFTSDLYTLTGRVKCEFVMLKMNLRDRDYILFSVRDIGLLIKISTAGSKEHREFSSLKSSLEGLLVTMDSNGVILSIGSNNRSYKMSENPDAFIGKAPDRWLPRDVADNMVFSIKEALAVNVPTKTSFTADIGGKNVSLQVLFSPVPEDQKVLALFKEITPEKEIENKIKRLYDAAGRDAQSTAQQIESILNLGMNIFESEAGVVLRFSGKKDSKYTIVYASSNKLNLSKGLSFDADGFIDEVKDGSIITSNDAEARTAKGTLMKSRGVKAALAAPLYLGGKVAGALVFLSTRLRSFQSTDEDIMGLMTRILSMSIELRQADKLIIDSVGHLKRTLKYLDMPALVMDKDGMISFVNSKLLDKFSYNEDSLLGRSFFKSLALEAGVAKSNFWLSYENSSGKTFLVSVEMKNNYGKTAFINWKVHVIKDTQDKVDSFALIAVTDEDLLNTKF